MAMTQYIDDLITAFGSMPKTRKRDRIIKHLQKGAKLATSDSLGSIFDPKSHNLPSTRGRP